MIFDLVFVIVFWWFAVSSQKQQAFAQYYAAKKDETAKIFSRMDLFDDKDFVFVLDEFGSI